MRPGVRRARCEQGFVVAEAALVIPTILAVAMSAVFLMSVVVSMLGLQDAAHIAAREVARGSSPHSIHEALTASYPQTTVTVAPTPQGVAVTVHRDVRVFGGLFAGLSLPMHRQAIVPYEAGVGIQQPGPIDEPIDGHGD